MGKYKRTQFVVEKAIQFRFARFVMLFVGLTAFLTSSIVFFTTLALLGDKLAAVYPQGRLAPIVRSAYIVFFANLAVAAPIIFAVSIRFSHRIVGPLPKIYNYLKNIGEGKYTGKLIIRQKDELKDLAASINQMAESLKAKGYVEEVNQK